MDRVFFFIFACFLSFQGNALDCQDQPVVSFEDDQGNPFQIIIPRVKIAASPPWSPAIDDLPLSIREVTLRVEEWAQETFSEFDRVVVDSVGVTQYKCPEPPARWFYSISIIPIKEGKKAYAFYQPIVMLFDGSIIRAQRAQQAR